MNVLLVDDGSVLRGYDCRDVLQVEQAAAPPDPAAFLVHLGRQGCRKEVRCREVLGFCTLSARDIRPLPAVLRERMSGEAPWGVGITGRGLCLLF